MSNVQNVQSVVLQLPGDTGRGHPRPVSFQKAEIRWIAQNIATVPRMLGWDKDKTQARSEELDTNLIIEAPGESTPVAQVIVLPNGDAAAIGWKNELRVALSTRDMRSQAMSQALATRTPPTTPFSSNRRRTPGNEASASEMTAAICSPKSRAPRRASSSSSRRSALLSTTRRGRQQHLVLIAIEPADREAAAAVAAAAHVKAQGRVAELLQHPGLDLGVGLVLRPHESVQHQEGGIVRAIRLARFSIERLPWSGSSYFSWTPSPLLPWHDAHLSNTIGATSLAKDGAAAKLGRDAGKVDGLIANAASVTSDGRPSVRDLRAHGVGEIVVTSRTGSSAEALAFWLSVGAEGRIIELGRAHDVADRNRPLLARGQQRLVVARGGDAARVRGVARPGGGREIRAKVVGEARVGQGHGGDVEGQPVREVGRTVSGSGHPKAYPVELPALEHRRLDQAQVEQPRWHHRVEGEDEHPDAAGDHHRVPQVDELPAVPPGEGVKPQPDH